jgi:hypothetical protein
VVQNHTKKIFDSFCFSQKGSLFSPALFWLVLSDVMLELTVLRREFPIITMQEGKEILTINDFRKISMATWGRGIMESKYCLIFDLCFVTNSHILYILHQMFLRNLCMHGFYCSIFI